MTWCKNRAAPCHCCVATKTMELAERLIWQNMQVGIALIFYSKGDICYTTGFFLYLLLLVKFGAFFASSLFQVRYF